MVRALDGETVPVEEVVEDDRVRRGAGPQDLGRIAAEKAVPLGKHGAPAGHPLADGDDLPPAHIAAAAVHLPRLPAEIEAGAVLPVADLLRLLRDPFGERSLRVAGPGVDGAAVGVGGRGGVVGRFRPSLDFEAADARARQFRDMADHAQVAGVEDIGPAVPLGDGHVPPGAGLLDQRVLPPAGLRALTAVAVPPGEIVREQATPGKRHAHRSVDKGFELQLFRRLRADPGDLLQRELAGEDHARGPQLVKRPGGGPARDARLGGDVDRDARGVFLREAQHAQVRHDQRVHAGLPGGSEELRQAGALFVVHDGVAGQVDPHARGVGEPDRRGQFLRSEIGRRGAHTEFPARKVDRVRPEADGRLQPLAVARGGEDFRLGAAAFPAHQRRPAFFRLARCWDFVAA